MPALMLVKAADSPVPDSPGKWLAGEVVVIVEVGATLGSGEEVAGGSFFHITITDKTVAEVNQYLEAYNKKLSYVSDQFNPIDDNRRWTTTNDRVSVTGNNGFTLSGINAAITAWNAEFPSNTVVLFDTDNLSWFTTDGIMPVALYEDWQRITQENALADYYARRRWYITSAGMTAIGNQGGSITGTAAELNPFLRDGLLD